MLVCVFVGARVFVWGGKGVGCVRARAYCVRVPAHLRVRGYMCACLCVQCVHVRVRMWVV